MYYINNEYVVFCYYREYQGESIISDFQNNMESILIRYQWSVTLLSYISFEF